MPERRNENGSQLWWHISEKVRSALAEAESPQEMVCGRIALAVPTANFDALPMGKMLGFQNSATGGWLTLHVCYGCNDRFGMPLPGTSVDVQVHGGGFGGWGEGSFAVLQLNQGQVAFKNMLDYSWLGVDSTGTTGVVTGTVSSKNGNPTIAETS